MKKFLIVLVFAVVLLGVGLWFLATNLNGLVASAIETHGSEVTETTVSVAGVDISLREGSGSISNLRIGSPEGFRARDVFELGDITVDLDVESLGNDPIVIEEIRIRAPVIHAEFLEDGSSNLQELRRRIEQHTAGAGGGPGGGGAEKKLRIQRFVFEEGRIEVDASALGLEPRTIELPEIRLNDVGGEAGAPPDRVAQVALGELTRRTASEIASGEVQRLIEEKLGGSLEDAAIGVLKGLGG